MFIYSESHIPCELYPIGSVLGVLKIKPAKPSGDNYQNMSSTQFYVHHPAVIPIMKNVKLENMVRNLLLTLVKIINDNYTILKNWQTSLNTLDKVVMNFSITLGFLLASHGSVCTISETLGYSWYISLFGLP